MHHCFHDKDIIAYMQQHITDFSLAHVQPSSYEPMLSDFGFLLDTEHLSVLRPHGQKRIYDMLLSYPQKYRQPIDISKGFLLKKGATCIIKLQEECVIPPGIFCKSSPKSSTGRLFVDVRLFADYSAVQDELHASEQKRSLWLFIQPLAFDIVLYSGIALNQLRFFDGPSAVLSHDALLALWKKHPLYIHKVTKKPITPLVTLDGLAIHVDAQGKNSSGIVGFKAKQLIKAPIDLLKKDYYDVLDYFYPILAKPEGIVIEPQSYYLLVSKEIVYIPHAYNAELRMYSHVGFKGFVHLAGFVDNGFCSDLVFEVRSDEQTSFVLQDGAPISTLDVYYTGKSERIYGSQKLGSHYQGQKGPRTAKFFKIPTYKHIAQQKDTRTIGCLSDVSMVRKPISGFVPHTLKEVSYIFHTSSDVESDNLLYIPKVMLVLTDGKGALFCYKINKTYSVGFVDVLFEESVYKTAFSMAHRLSSLVKKIQFLGTIYEKGTRELGYVFLVHVGKHVLTKQKGEFCATLSVDNSYDMWSEMILAHIANYLK
ncbi:MAG: 2'-deoxycytidine 5'-triphosphate deaminase domain-containing protein [Candidatus Woesearchaeota archaeon]